MKYNVTAIRQHQASRLLTRDYLETGKNILGDGLKLCQRAKAHNSQNPSSAIIAVEKKAVKEKINNVWTTKIATVARMHDVAQCGNAQLCPHCSGFTASHLRNWIDEAFLPSVRSKKMRVALLTLTAHHRRDSDWTEFTKNFFLALDVFRKSMERDFKKIGSLGRVRAIETPVGSNGLHIHVHDLLTYSPTADLEKFQEAALKRWKAALKQFRLSCNSHGVDLKEEGDFDPCYVAKEIAAHDTKNESKSDLKNLFQLLDMSARGDKQASQDWIRAAKAIQGRDRWNVGQLATKLGIPCPSNWKRPEGMEKAVDPRRLLIEYPQSHHMIATSPNNDRAGLAFILRAARNEAARPGTTQRMVLRMCDETIKCEVEQIKAKHAKKLAQLLKPTLTTAEEEKLCGVIFSRCTFAISEYRATTYSYMYPKQSVAPIAVVDTSNLVPGLELDFS